MTQPQPAEFWEQRYADAGPVWSGRVNRTLADAVVDLPPGRSLDLGCGEGGDVLWLAERGWLASGIDFSRTAVARAEQAAADRGLPPERVHFIAADLADWAERPAEVDGSPEPFDLIAASFLQSPIELPRSRVLQAAAARLATGGHLVLVTHAAPPPWVAEHRGEEHGGGASGDGASGGRATGGGPKHFHTPESELEVLALDPAGWRVVVAEVREREATSPEGEPAVLQDTLVVVRRQG